MDGLLDGSAAAAGPPPTASPLRWWVLATYSIMAANQGLTWSVPGTLSTTQQAVYGISADTTQLLLNYGPIFYLVCMLPVNFVIDRFGIRAATLSAIALVLVANVLRCFANDASVASLVMLHVSFILNAAAGPAAMAVPSKLAEDWFAPKERTTATAIAALSNQTGVLFLYLFVPTVAPNPDATNQLRLNLVLAAISAANVLMAAAYFPSHPPHAPSASAKVTKKGEARTTLAGMAASWQTMMRSAPYVAIVVVYSLFVGASNCTSALLTSNLQAIGADLATSGWVGFAGNAGALVVGVALGFVADSLKARPGALKAVLVASLVGSSLCYFAYTLLLLGAGSAIGTGSLRLYLTAAAFTGANVLLSAAIPLEFDLAAELTFPEPEGSMLMLLTGAMNLVSLFVLFAPASSFFSWANWTVSAIGLGGAVVLAVVLPTNAPRFDYDLLHASETGDEEGEGDEDGGAAKLKVRGGLSLNEGAR